MGIKVPVKNLGRTNRSTEEILHGNQEESRQEKETLSGRMLVQKFPKASREKHLQRGFSVLLVLTRLENVRLAHPEERQTAHSTHRLHFWGLLRSPARARNAYTEIPDWPP